MIKGTNERDASNEQPAHMGAEWTTDYTIPIAIIAAVAALVVVVVALRRRKHGPSSEI
jgi:hypothetical protein